MLSRSAEKMDETRMRGCVSRNERDRCATLEIMALLSRMSCLSSDKDSSCSIWIRRFNAICWPRSCDSRSRIVSSRQMKRQRTLHVMASAPCAPAHSRCISSSRHAYTTSQPVSAVSNVSRSSGRFVKCESRMPESRTRRFWIWDSEALMDEDSAHMAVMVEAAFWYLSRRLLRVFACVRTVEVRFTWVEMMASVNQSSSSPSRTVCGVGTKQQEPATHHRVRYCKSFYHGRDSGWSWRKDGQEVDFLRA